MKLLECLMLDLAAEGRRRSFGSLTKAFFFSPGFQTVLWYRLARSFHGKGRVGRFISRVLWLHNIRRSGCHISPLAKIGAGLWLPHSTGIVIGEGVVIGDNVTIYQNVTVGTGRSDEGAPGYPAIGNQVIIYSNAVVFGAIRVGHHARIAAGEVLSRSLQENETFKLGTIRQGRASVAQS